MHNFQAICSLCVKDKKTGEFSCKKGNTSTLIRHAESAHKSNWKEIVQLDKESIKAPIQSVLEIIKPTGPKYKINSSRREELNQKVVSMIVKDLRPISIVEDEGFRDLLSTADPMYVPPSRKTLSEKLIPNRFKREMDEIKLYDLNRARYVGITTDAWTSNSTDG